MNLTRRQRARLEAHLVMYSCQVGEDQLARELRFVLEDGIPQMTCHWVSANGGTYVCHANEAPLESVEEALVEGLCLMIRKIVEKKAELIAALRSFFEHCTVDVRGMITHVVGLAGDLVVEEAKQVQGHLKSLQTAFA